MPGGGGSSELFLALLFKRKMSLSLPDNGIAHHDETYPLLLSWDKLMGLSFLLCRQLCLQDPVQLRELLYARLRRLELLMAGVQERGLTLELPLQILHP